MDLDLGFLGLFLQGDQIPTERAGRERKIDDLSLRRVAQLEGYRPLLPFRDFHGRLEASVRRRLFEVVIELQERLSAVVECEDSTRHVRVRFGDERRLGIA